MNILKRFFGRRSEAKVTDKQAHKGRLLPPPRDVGQMDIGNGLTLDVDYDDQQTLYRFRAFLSSDFDKVVKEFKLQLGRFRGSSGSDFVIPIALISDDEIETMMLREELESRPPVPLSPEMKEMMRLIETGKQPDGTTKIPMVGYIDGVETSLKVTPEGHVIDPTSKPLRDSPLSFDPSAYGRAIEEVKRTVAAIAARERLKGSDGRTFEVTDAEIDEALRQK